MAGRYGSPISRQARNPGSPAQLSPEQYTQLEKAGQLTDLAAGPVLVENGAAALYLHLPRQAVTLLVIDGD